MFTSLYRFAKQILFSLRFSLLFIFVTLFAVALLLIIVINYEDDVKALAQSANELMNQVSLTLAGKLADQVQETTNDMRSVSSEIQNVIDPNDINTMVNYTVAFANGFSIQQALYWGDENGTFIDAEYDLPGSIDKSLTTQIIDRRTKNPIVKYIYRDLNGKIIKTVTTNKIDYDPRIRPWYRAAKQANKFVWTDIYLFEPNYHLGVTLAAPIYNQNGQFRGVLGIDIGLHWLSKFLSEQQVSSNAKIIILSKNGDVIAFPEFFKKQKYSDKLVNIDALNIPWLSYAFNFYEKNKINRFSFRFKGHIYLANFREFTKIPNVDWTIGIVAPIDDFTKELTWLSIFNVITGLVILLISVILIWIFVARIVKPINKLVYQTNKIKQFKLEDEAPVISRIKEVNLLTEAIVSLRTGLKAFQRYVPAGLVRQLIKTGENARIGGKKCSLTIMFSDIRNFTTITENTHPDAMMKQICEYFDELSKIIASEKGTIDKYIGDSIMAFWGAPLLIKNPNLRAARTALKCIQRSEQLNLVWQQQHKLAFITNIGLHTGEAIVGNVGSTERLNYTALGDSINIASRLESLNKIYGTKVMVSCDTYQLIKNKFVLRKVDIVAVKGKIKAFQVYELLAETLNELTFDFAAYQECYEKAFSAYQLQHWDEAMTLFTQCLELYPEDKLTHVFIKRCARFKDTPPINWDGIWRIVE